MMASKERSRWRAGLIVCSVAFVPMVTLLLLGHTDGGWGRMYWTLFGITQGAVAVAVITRSK